MAVVGLGTWTAGDATAWAIPRMRHVSPRSGAEALLAHVLGASRERLIAHPELLLTAEQAAQYRGLVERCAAGEPLHYLLGVREFYGLDFAVDSRVLIPRPETEHLVEAALAWATALEARGRGPQRSARLDVADVGTGSGAIAVALAVKLPQARVVATDVSAAALAVAHSNAVRHGVAERVMLAQADLLAPFGRAFDLVVANLPYVGRDEQSALEAEPNVAAHEPHVALDGGQDGLELVARLLAEAPACLRPGAALFLEIGAGQAARAWDLAREAFPDGSIRTARDLAGHERIVAIETHG